MKDSQFTTLVQMFAELSKQVDDLRQEMRSEFATVRQEMARDFAIQQETSHEILNAVSGPFGELQTEVKKIKSTHGKRLRRIEHQIGLA